MSCRIISFSGKKHSGKSLAASVLTEKYGYTLVVFADCLKDLVCKVIGISRDKLEETKDIGVVSAFNQEQINLLSKELGFEQSLFAPLAIKETYTIREVLQILGTDIIRKNRPNWHVDKVREILKDTSKKFVVADSRFPNEVKAVVEEFNGTAFLITRPQKNTIVLVNDSDTEAIVPNGIVDNDLVFEGSIERKTDHHESESALLNSRLIKRIIINDYPTKEAYQKKIENTINRLEAVEEYTLKTQQKEFVQESEDEED